jgi:hypothetical protein
VNERREHAHVCVLRAAVCGEREEREAQRTPIRVKLLATLAPSPAAMRCGEAHEHMDVMGSRQPRGLDPTRWAGGLAVDHHTT